MRTDWLTAWLAQLVDNSLFGREVVDLFPGRVMPKTLKIEPAALSLGAQHTGSEHGNRQARAPCVG